MKNSRLRLGLVGAGFGAKVHVPALRLCPEAELVGAVARSDKARAALNAAAPGLPLYEEPGQLLAAGLDGLIVAVPPVQAAEIIGTALAAGCGVFAEKPLAGSPTVAQHLARMAARRGVPNMVNYSYLGLELFQWLKLQLQTGSLGPLRTVQMRWTVESLAQKHRAWSWKTDAAAGGGVFTTIGCHFVALLCYLLGEPVRQSVFVSNRATSVFAPPEAQAAVDTVSWISEHRGGVWASALLSNASPGEPCLRWELVFERGVVEIASSALDYYSGLTMTLRAPGQPPRTVLESADDNEPAPQRATRRMLQAFFAQYAGGARDFSDFAFGAVVDGRVAAALTPPRANG